MGTRVLLHWLVIAGFMAVLAVLSLAPARSAPVRASPLRLQKLMHVLLYALLAGLWAWGLARAGLGSGPAALAAWLVASGFGGLMELAQRSRPRRSASWADAARNAVGAAGGAAVAAWLLGAWPG